MWSCRFCPTGLSKQEATAANLKLIQNKLLDLNNECEQKRSGDFWLHHDKDPESMTKLMKFMANDYMYYSPNDTNKLKQTFTSNIYINADSEEFIDENLLNNRSCEAIYKFSMDKDLQDEIDQIKYKENELKNLQEKLRKLARSNSYGQTNLNLYKARALFGGGKKVEKLRDQINDLSEEIAEFYRDNNITPIHEKQKEFCNSLQSFKQCLIAYHNENKNSKGQANSELEKTIDNLDSKIKEFNNNVIDNN